MALCAAEAARRVRRLDEGRPAAATRRRSAWDGAPELVDYFDFSHDATLRSLEESLERLGLDRVDIAFVHDPDDHFDEALAGSFRALRRLRDEGVVRAIGVGANQPAVLCRFAREADPGLLPRRRPLHGARPSGGDRAAPAVRGERDRGDRGRRLQQRRHRRRDDVRLRDRAARRRRAGSAAPRDLRPPRRPARRRGGAVPAPASSRRHGARRLPHAGRGRRGRPALEARPAGRALERAGRDHRLAPALLGPGNRRGPGLHERGRLSPAPLSCNVRARSALTGSCSRRSAPRARAPLPSVRR